MSNISIVQLSAYTSPVIQENKKSDYIEYGVDNNYFQYLIDRYLYSATNNAIITGVTNMIYGKGLDALDSNKKPNEYAQMRSIIKGDCLKKVALERKMLGMGAMQVIKEKGKVKKIDHFPMNTLRAEKCNDKGEIEAWYYFPDWTKKKPSEKAKRIPAFGFGNGNEVEMYVVHPYVSGFHYYTPIDYSGALPYAKLEEEISDYLINDVQNGFSGTKVINFNNGVPTEEMRDKIKRDVLGKLTGSRGEKVIVAFNANAESKTTVEDIPLNDAPAHYEYLSTECFEKLIVGHRVTSPMLLGIRDTGGGLGNNADEIQTATLLMDNIVIKPYQLELINAIDEILAVNDISLKLYFKTIQPLEFVDVSGMDAETKEEETGVKMSSEKVCCSSNEDFTDEEGNKLLESLNGESVDEEWELVDKREFSDSNVSIEEWANSKISKKENLFQKLAGIIKSNASSKSYLDKDTYKVRYEYSEIAGTDRDKSRDFCKKMMNRTERGVVYRKEDIDQASFSGVNNEFGHNKQNYSLWLYAGGVYCHHFWSENLYRLRTKTDGQPYVDKSLASSEEVDSIAGYNPNPSGLATAQTAPINRAGRGEYPS
jgi:hypothetical protein